MAACVGSTCTAPNYFSSCCWMENEGSLRWENLALLSQACRLRPSGRHMAQGCLKCPASQTSGSSPSNSDLRIYLTQRTALSWPKSVVWSCLVCPLPALSPLAGYGCRQWNDLDLFNNINTAFFPSSGRGAFHNTRVTAGKRWLQMHPEKFYRLNLLRPGSKAFPERISLYLRPTK